MRKEERQERATAIITEALKACEALCVRVLCRDHWGMSHEVDSEGIYVKTSDRDGWPIPYEAEGVSP